MSKQITDPVLAEARARLETLWFVYHGNLVDARVLRICITALDNYEKARHVLCDNCGLFTGDTFIVGRMDSLGPVGVFCETCFTEFKTSAGEGTRYMLQGGHWRRS